MKKLLLSVLALSVVVPFLASAAEETPEERASRMGNGNPMDVVQSWGRTGSATSIVDCQLYTNGPVVKCFDLSLPKTTPATPQEALLSLQQQLVVLLTQLLTLLTK